MESKSDGRSKVSSLKKTFSLALTLKINSKLSSSINFAKEEFISILK